MSNLGMYEATEEVLGDFSPLPNGKYTVCVVESELKDNKAGTGNYIQLKLEVMDGKFKGRWINFVNITFTHSTSQTAQEIGRKTLNTLMKACGIQNIQDTKQLHGIAITAEVIIKQSEGYAPNNEVKNYFALDGAAQGTAPAPAPATATADPVVDNAPAQGGDASPSWAK